MKVQEFSRKIQKKVYNLEFPPWCPSMAIYGYKFIRVDDYHEQMLRLQHRIASVAEYEVQACSGEHAITAFVELPKREDSCVLGWANHGATALNDILLLLSIFTGRDVFEVEDSSDNVGVVLADPRQYQWGGELRCSIPYKKQPVPDPEDLGFEYVYNIGFEEGLSKIYALMRGEEWQRKYEHGYFLLLAKQAFHHQVLESSFTQCWTIWEHLFTVHNRHWLSDNQIRQLDSSAKIAFILTEYALKPEIDASSLKRIAKLAEIRNRLVHFGKFPERGSVHDDATLFIRLTTFIIAKILGLLPSDLFNTIEKLEKFFSASINSTEQKTK